MITQIKHRRFNLAYRLSSVFVALAFGAGTIAPPPTARAQAYVGAGFKPALTLPLPGTMLSTTPAFTPALVKGITVHPDNPLQFNFIIDTGVSGLDIQSEAFKQESTRLIKYFLAALTVPDEELWVNLSPYESERIIAD